MENLSTSERILEVAHRCVQQRGFNAFSYADIATQIGIKTSSIHYYFPTKDDLGEALIGEAIANGRNFTIFA